MGTYSNFARVVLPHLPPTVLTQERHLDGPPGTAAPLLGLTSRGVTREDLLPARVAVATLKPGDMQTRKYNTYTTGSLKVIKNCL